MLLKQGWDGEKPLLGIAVIDPFCWPVRASLWKWIKGICSGDLSGQNDKWYFFSDSPSRRKDYKRYIQKTARAVGFFLSKYDYFPVLIGMERLDKKACRALMKRLPCSGAMFLSGDCSADIMTGILHRQIQSQLVKYRNKLADMGVFLKQYIQDALQHNKGGLL